MATNTPTTPTRSEHAAPPVAPPGVIADNVTVTDSATGSAAEYVCPMHADVRRTKPGTCPKCGMALERVVAPSAQSAAAPVASASASDSASTGNIVSLDGRNIVCSTTTDPKGWYAELFYEQSSAMWHDPVIADVHTQPTDENGNMVGRVLHVGTGKPRMMTIKIQHDGGKNAQTYRGYVSSYAEVITEGFHRMTDEEWRSKTSGKLLGTPPWMSSIVVR